MMRTWSRAAIPLGIAISAFYGIYSLSFRSYENGYKRDTGQENEENSRDTNGQKIVILYSNQRSGSSFMGDVFNHYSKAFYLYEPLFPFTPHCDFLQSERIEALERMLNCDFTENMRFFKLAKPITNFPDYGPQCLNHGVCFYMHSNALMKEISKLCPSGSFAKTCRPFSPGRLGELCSTSNLVAYKILRICSLRDIDAIFKRLREQGKNVYVVHLLRDPRGTLSSKLHLELKKQRLDEECSRLCNKIENNLRITYNQTVPLEIIRQGRYKLVRYEDAANDPITIATDIYKFLGMDLPEGTKSWLEESSALIQKVKEDSDDSVNEIKNRQLVKKIANPYTTIKDGSITSQKWRLQQPLQIVERIQRTCSYVLEHLGYRSVWTIQELQNMNHTLY